MVNGDRKDIPYWPNFVFEPIAKLWKCIKENVFDVPKMFGFELLDLLTTRKHIFMIKIDERALIVARWLQIERKTTKFNII